MKLYDTPPARAGIRAILYFARIYRDVYRAKPQPQQFAPPYSYPPEYMADVDKATTGLLDAVIFTSDDSRPIIRPIAQAPLQPNQVIRCEYRYMLTVPQWFRDPHETEQRRQIWWQSQSERFMADLLAHGEEFLRQYAEAIDASFP